MPKPKNSPAFPLPQGIRDLRHLTQQLNMLKRQILGIRAQHNVITSQLNKYTAAQGFGGAVYSWPVVDRLTIHRLTDLQAIANAYGIKGDYTRVLPFEETRLGKRIIEREWAALPERFRIRTLPLEECQRLYKINQDSLAKTPPEERKLIALSLPEKKGMQG